GEQITGGSGAADRIVVDPSSAGTFNFGAVTISGVEQFEFRTNGAVAFEGSQIGGAAGAIHTVTGTALFDRIDVSGDTVDLSAVVFKNWSASNAINITGGAG